MPRAQQVPVSAETLRWAIEEAGVGLPELSDRIGVAVEVIEDWLANRSKPTLTVVRRLSEVLRRPLAALLLPLPPEQLQARVQFRKPVESDRTTLLPGERSRFREALRLQRGMNWVCRQTGERSNSLATHTILEASEAVAIALRQWTGIELDQQVHWRSDAVATKAWRLALENRGIAVLMLSLGRQSIRGASVWDDYSPLIIVNTALRPSARTFTLMHELGHLASRSSSACLDEWASLREENGDQHEKWCDRVAAAVLMPREAVRVAFSSLGDPVVVDVAIASRIASMFRVSLRAAALRLIECGYADWTLYDALPAATDASPEDGGGGGGGRVRLVKRQDEYGRRIFGVFNRAVTRDVLDRTDVLDYLAISDSDLDVAGEREV